VGGSLKMNFLCLELVFISSSGAGKFVLHPLLGVEEKSSAQAAGSNQFLSRDNNWQRGSALHGALPW
jgi:ABC-type spermidine/putrescine transport system permease subunit I